MPFDGQLPVPAAFTGCAHDETCRNMAVMEALRVQLVAALAELTVLARAVDGVKHLILGGWHEPLCPVGDTCAGCQVRHALAAPLTKAALTQPELAKERERD